MVKKYLTVLLVLIFALFGFFANAQIRESDVVLDILPQYPNPNQNVNATLNSHSINLDKANMSWSVNGEESSNGIGKKSFSFTVGGLGTPTVLSVSIETLDGQNIVKTKTITPGNVDMLWEAYDSYTPPFYKGKTLVSSQGMFKVIALPNLMTQNGKSNANNLSYTWIKDGTNNSSSSGWGKNYFIFQNSYLEKENTIGVKISDITGNTNTTGKIILKTVNPKIIFYENDPEFGIKRESALNNGFTINSDGKNLIAEPYFFSPKNISSSILTFGWSLNGQEIETPNPKNILSIKPESGQSGNASIKILITNTNTLFQSISKQLSVTF